MNKLQEELELYKAMFKEACELVHWSCPLEFFNDEWHDSLDELDCENRCETPPNNPCPCWEIYFKHIVKEKKNE